MVYVSAGVDLFASATVLAGVVHKSSANLFSKRVFHVEASLDISCASPPTNLTLGLMTADSAHVSHHGH